MRPRKPVCVKCKKTFRCENNNAILVEFYQSNSMIYKIWRCDIYKCPKCGVEICYGFGDRPVMTNIDGQDACREYVKKSKVYGNKVVYDLEG
jgi:hypothetical protein